MRVIRLSISVDCNKLSVNFNNNDAIEFYNANKNAVSEILIKCENKFLYEPITSQVIESIIYFWKSELYNKFSDQFVNFEVVIDSNY